MTENPKDLVGSTKVSLTALPAVAIAHGSHAMMHGRAIYGPYNWRATKVRASIYIDAALRHLLSWYEGEDIAPDSGVHHLGHAIAGLSITLDAEACGCLIDDRPIHGNPVLMAGTLARLADVVKSRTAQVSGPESAGGGAAVVTIGR